MWLERLLVAELSARVQFAEAVHNYFVLYEVLAEQSAKVQIAEAVHNYFALWEVRALDDVDAVARRGLVLVETQVASTAARTEEGIEQVVVLVDRVVARSIVEDIAEDLADKTVAVAVLAQRCSACQ